MFRLSAFADEIGPDPREQLAVLAACRVRFVEFRSIHATNVLALSDAHIDEFRRMLADAGIGVSAIGSPVGKAPIDAPFDAQLDKLKRAVDLCGVFGTPNVRVFSFYPPANTPFAGDWAPHRDEVLRRLWVMAEVAAGANVTLLHENEHNIYGDTPERVRDVLASVDHPNLRGAYDAANYVFCGTDPMLGWNLTRQYTTHLHIKDWKRGGTHGVLAGTGDGMMDHSIGEAVAAGYDGFAVLEPHLRGGGPTGGVTGADLFPAAVEAFRTVLARFAGREG